MKQSRGSEATLFVHERVGAFSELPPRQTNNKRRRKRRNLKVVRNSEWENYKDRKWRITARKRWKEGFNQRQLAKAEVRTIKEKGKRLSKLKKKQRKGSV